VDIELQFIIVNAGVAFRGRCDESFSHVLQPIDMTFGEISQAPYIASFNQPKQMQRR